MAKTCDAPCGCDKSIFRTDRKTLKRYCLQHYFKYSTDIDKRSPMQKAADKKKKEGRVASVKTKVRSLAKSDANKKAVSEVDVEQQLWFIARSKEMTGRCIECGEPSTKNLIGRCTCGALIDKEIDTCVNCGELIKKDRKLWKYSICHIFPKKIFKSIAKHPLNFIELCYYGNSHHTNMDNNGYQYVKEKMPVAWMFIVKQAKILYPFIAQEERQFIPDVLLNAILN